jgi:hypothetical protein
MRTAKFAVAPNRSPSINCLLLSIEAIGSVALPAEEEEEKYAFDSFGARGIGEIGISGTPAAVANAIYHAAGKRIRQLPIRPEHLLA